MSTVIEQSPEITRLIQTTTFSRDRLLKTLSFVPADKLNWSPAPTAKTAIQIAAHCGVTNGFFKQIISTGTFPDGPMDELLAGARAAEAQITTVDQAVSLIKSSTDDLLDTIGALTPEQLDKELATPMMTMPVRMWCFIPGRHLDNHASQIDYLQTCWGDMDWHM